MTQVTVPQLPASVKSLPADAARLCLDVRKFIEQCCPLLVKQKVLVAVSGGADSICLLAVLSLLRKRLQLTIEAAHINHHLRAESQSEATYVMQLCQTWNIPCYCDDIFPAAYAKEHDLGLEEASRTLRYAALETIRQHSAAAYVCTGHHCGDLQEDILMRLVRGSGWPALGGMPAFDAERYLCRPLLCTDKRRLQDFLQTCGIYWHEDASNADTKYTRNNIRHTIVPLLEKINPSLTVSISHLWQMAQDDAQYWQQSLEALLHAHGIAAHAPVALLPLSLLQTCPTAVRMRLYMWALRSYGFRQARYDTLSRLDTAVMQKKTGTYFQFPGGLVATVARTGVVFNVGQHSL